MEVSAHRGTRKKPFMTAMELFWKTLTTYCTVEGVTLIDVYISKRAGWNWLKLHVLDVQVIRRSWNFVTVLIYSLGQDYEIGRGVVAGGNKTEGEGADGKETKWEVAEKQKVGDALMLIVFLQLSLLFGFTHIFAHFCTFLLDFVHFLYKFCVVFYHA